MNAKHLKLRLEMAMGVLRDIAGSGKNARRTAASRYAASFVEMIDALDAEAAKRKKKP